MDAENRVKRWAVTKESKPFLLEWQADQLSLLKDDSVVRSWVVAETTVTFPSAYSVSIADQHDEPVSLGFTSTRAQAEFRAALEGRAVPVTGSAPTPRPPQRGAIDAQDILLYSILLGVIFEAMGGAIMGAYWPSASGSGDGTGNVEAFIFGLVMVSVGSSILLIGLVGLGVKYGVIAARDSR